MQQAIADCKSVTGDDLVIMSDLCVDEYTDHGHCGVVNDDGSIDNDLTLVTVPGAGHFVHHDKPNFVNGTLKMWLMRDR